MKFLRGIASIVMMSLWGWAAPLSAQEETTYQYTFGQQATFTITLPAAIPEAILYLQLNHGQTTSYPVALTMGRGKYIRDLRAAPFPAYADITYWWMYQDASSNSHSSPKHTFLYEDNRYRWQSLRSGKVNLYWVAGDSNVMNTALDIAQQTWSDLQKYLHIPEEQKVSIYIYPSLQDMQSALRLTGQSWVGGVARPEVGVVLINLPPHAGALSKMKRDIPHEMTHKALYDLLGPQGYESLPLWLEEGLSSTFEQSPDPTYVELLRQAQRTGSLLDMKTLCNTLPTEREQIMLAYAQMQSFVTYLIENYGWTQLRALLNSYADGLSCTVGVEQIYGRHLSTLEREWRAWLSQENFSHAHWSQNLIHILPWLLLLLLINMPALLQLLLA